MEPIISKELWEKTQALLKDNKQLYKKGQHKTVKIKHWSQGLVKCGNCGKALCISSLDYYQCNGYSKGACKISHAIKIEWLESIVCSQLKEVFENEIKVNVVPKETSSFSNEYEMISSELSRFDEKLKRLKEAYKNGVDTLEEYKEGKATLENERNNLIEKMELIKNELDEENEKPIYHRIKNVYDLLTDDKIPIDIKYKASHFLINKITFYKQKNMIEIEYK